MRLAFVLFVVTALSPVYAQQVMESREQVVPRPAPAGDAPADPNAPPTAKKSEPQKREPTKEARAKAKELLDKAYEAVNSASPAVQVSALIHLADDKPFCVTTASMAASSDCRDPPSNRSPGTGVKGTAI